MRKSNLFFKILLASILLVSGVFTVSAQDVNCDNTVNIVDALVIAQYSVGLIDNLDCGGGDVNCDNTINIVDALVIAQYSVGLIDNLGCGGTPTATPRRTPTPRVTPTPNINVTPAPRVDNPFSGNIKWYVNPDWVKNAEASGGSGFSDINTAVWMDRIGAIAPDLAKDNRGLVGHLDEALAQDANMFMVVIYDLPGRDCAASASNGELPNSPEGLSDYKTLYIDPIVAILSKPEYKGLRIVCIIEPDSLPNLVTNEGIPNCADVIKSKVYVDGVQYAISELNTVPNVYQYIDIAHSGWLGWDSNLGPAANLIADVVTGSTDGPNGETIAGFVSNTANYTPVEEPYFTATQSIGGQPARSADFYEWNDYIDELKYVRAMRNLFIQNGVSRDIGMLIDTSRNGWGGSDRPTRASSSSNLNTFVDESRIDRRLARGNWCNQVGAGIGLRPVAAPAADIDAYVWVKPPGESDGVSKPGVDDPVDQNKTFDTMCGPNENSTYDPSVGTGAMDAPHAGRWNETQFQELVQNAYPEF
jgi:cellulose 1,4-beta-cellobiosidase